MSRLHFLVDNFALLGAAKDDCPDPEDRIVMQRDWSCEEYESFMPLQTAYVINVLVIKTVQVFIFTFLAFLLAI